MTEAGIILPWWLISLLAGVLMTLIVWQRQQLRHACWHACWHALDASSTILDRLRLRCAEAADSCQERANKAFFLFTGYLAATRYRLAMVDYMQLLTRRWQTIEALCKDSDALIDRAYRELDAAHMEKPEAPEWVAAADAIGGLPGGNSQPATTKILQAILAAAESQHAEAMREFRWAAALRGRALLASARYWRQLKVRLTAIEEFGEALKAGEQTLAKTSARLGELENQGQSRRLLRGLVGALLATVLLGTGVWFCLFLIAAQQSMVDSFIAGNTLAPGWADVWPSFYLIALLVLGATAACAARVTDMFSRIAELGARWRARIGILCVLLLVLLSGGGMQMVVADMRDTLLSAGWTELSAFVASGLLYALPLFLSIQLCVMVHWIRASKPLTYTALEYAMRAGEKGLAASCALSAYLRNGIVLEGIAVLSEQVAESGSSREPSASKPAAEGVTLVAKISSKKAG
jgi:hypothetical protein